MKQKIKTYGYDDWWTGKIHLAYSPGFFRPDETVISGVLWKEIEESNISKIKAKQRELFENAVLTLFEKFKTTFLNRFENSQMKEYFLKDELQQCMSLMFGKIPGSETVIIKQWNTTFYSLDLRQIQAYIDEVIKKGIPQEFDYIHSPNFRYQEKKIPNEIYAQTLWNYFCWLETFEKSLENTNSSTTPKIVNQAQKKDQEADKVQFNSQIFPNETSFLLFQALLKEFEDEIQTAPLSHLSFIYWSMKRDGHLHNVKPTAFREFIMEKPYSISLEKLKTLTNSSSSSKVKGYSACLKQFQKS